MDRRKRKPMDVEARIRQEYTKLRAKHRKTGHGSYHHLTVAENVLMRLAARFKRPMAEIKYIVNYKGAANQPIVYQTAEQHRLDVAHKKCERLRNQWAWEEKWKSSQQ